MITNKKITLVLLLVVIFSMLISCTFLEATPDLPPVPEMPQNFAVIEKDFTSLTLSWFSTNWTTYFMLTNQDNQIIKNYIVNTTYKITNLTENTTYSFILKACNLAGCSAATSLLNIRTYSTTPTNFMVSARGATYLTFTWDAVRGATYYNFSYKNGTPIANNITSTSYTVTGLTKLVEYNVILVACNENKCFDKSAELIESTRDSFIVENLPRLDVTVDISTDTGTKTYMPDHFRTTYLLFSIAIDGLPKGEYLIGTRQKSKGAPVVSDFTATNSLTRTLSDIPINTYLPYHMDGTYFSSGDQTMTNAVAMALSPNTEYTVYAVAASGNDRVVYNVLDITTDPLPAFVSTSGFENYGMPISDPDQAKRSFVIRADDIIFVYIHYATSLAIAQVYLANPDFETPGGFSFFSDMDCSRAKGCSLSRTGDTSISHISSSSETPTEFVYIQRGGPQSKYAISGIPKIAIQFILDYEWRNSQRLIFTIQSKP